MQPHLGKRKKNPKQQQAPPAVSVLPWLGQLQHIWLNSPPPHQGSPRPTDAAASKRATTTKKTAMTKVTSLCLQRKEWVRSFFWFSMSVRAMSWPTALRIKNCKLLLPNIRVRFRKQEATRSDFLSQQSVNLSSAAVLIFFFFCIETAICWNETGVAAQKRKKKQWQLCVIHEWGALTKLPDERIKWDRTLTRFYCYTLGLSKVGWGAGGGEEFRSCRGTAYWRWEAAETVKELSPDCRPAVWRFSTHSLSLPDAHTDT